MYLNSTARNRRILYVYYFCLCKFYVKLRKIMIYFTIEENVRKSKCNALVYGVLDFNKSTYYYIVTITIRSRPGFAPC